MQEGRGPDAEWWDGSFADSDDPVVSAVALLILGAGLGSLFGVPILTAIDFWVIFAIGYAVVVPLTSLLRGRAGASPTIRADDTGGVSEDASEDDVDAALDRLRDRYARGELSDEQFERKLEALLETETPEDARARLERETEPDADGDVDREFERDR